MNGWQRFGLLLLCCFVVMVCYPEYTSNAWSFIGIRIFLWTCVLIVVSLISNILNLYKVEWLNKLITLAFMIAVVYSLLWFFPQKDNVTPVEKLKSGKIPTVEDVERGIKQVTFNFDFVRRNARREENFINQEIDEKKIKKEIKKKVSEQTDQMIEALDIKVDEEE